MTSPPSLPLGPPPSPAIPAGAQPIGDPKIQWLEDKLTEGEAFLSAQAGWELIGRAIEAIMSTDEVENLDSPPSQLSNTRTNRVAKIAEDLAAMLSDTKPFWEYSVSNRRFEQHAQIYSKLATFWYQRRDIDLRMAEVVKYYVVAGTGYLHMFWNPDIGDIDCCAEDPRNVVPISPSANNSLEACMGVIIKRKVPVSYIKERYNITVKSESDGSAVTWLSKARDAASDVVSPIWRWRKSNEKEDLPRIPTVTLKTAYLKDYRTNTKDDLGDEYTGQAIEMGQWKDQTQPDGSAKRIPANNWSYLVPPGDRLYPHRRMTVWVGQIELYDGPCFYWADQFPIFKLTLNPYPWSWLGKAPVWDLLRLQTSLNKLLRVVDDHAAQVAQPGSIHDKNNVSKSTYDSFDTRRSGWKIRQNPLAGKGVQIVNPPPLDSAIWEHIQWIQKEMKELSGTMDLEQLMTLKQMPTTSTVENILNAQTPALRFRSRILEAFQRQVAMQFAYNSTEFYTLSFRVAILGPSGIVQDDFDYDPGSLVPDYVGDKEYDQDGNITPEAMLRGPLPRYDRAQEFLRRFIFKISAGSLLNSAQMERTMIYFQLARAGTIDIITLLEQLNVPNIGVENLPDNVRTILDRLAWTAQMGIGMDVSPVGRKASAQESPRIKVSESG